MLDIKVTPKEVFKLYQKTKQMLADKSILIAKNLDTNYAIYMTEHDGGPWFMVYRGDKVEREDIAISNDDCYFTVTKLFANYLYPVEEFKSENIPVVDSFQDDDDVVYDTEGLDEEYSYEPDNDDDVLSLIEKQDDAIYQREDELLLGFYDFLDVILEKNEDGIKDLDDELAVDLMDRVIKLIFDESGVSIYRPTILDTEGGDVYTDYPYGD